jgi:YfiH family protein
VLAVRTADCVPVVIMGAAGVAVAHAGWRGTAAGVVGATVVALCGGSGMEPRDLIAVVGPHISGAAYEVGAEVVQGLAAAGLDPAEFVVAHSARGRPHVDLGRAVGGQLAALGVGIVAHIGGCTASDPQLYSHRADGPHTGRQAGLVARLP